MKWSMTTCIKTVGTINSVKPVHLKKMKKILLFIVNASNLRTWETVVEGSDYQGQHELERPFCKTKQIIIMGN